MRLLSSCVLLVGILGSVNSQAVTCPVGVDSRVVSNTLEASELSDALACEGAGHFEVAWSGSVLLAQTIVISNGIFVRVTASSGGEAVIDGGGALGLFQVDGGSLELNEVSLVRGLANWDNGFPGGGAVYATGFDHSRLVATSCSFINNSATISDGGLFDSADGGAIHWSVGDVSINGTTIFAENIATLGGAIFSFDGHISIDGNTTFVGNRGIDFGGAIYSNFSDVSINGITTFEDNTALWAGAIFSHDSDVSIDGSSTFTGNNGSISAGAINAATVRSSARSNLLIGGDSLFANNYCGGTGGALHVENAHLSIDGNTIFESNYAYVGGGAISSIISDVSIDGDCTFVGNTAGVFSGGALDMNEGGLAVHGRTEWIRNTADTVGGAIGSRGGDIFIDGNAFFAFNTAEENGGAISSTGGDIFIDGDAFFAYNIAEEDGGAIHLDNTTCVLPRGAASFTNNSAQGSGGALAVIQGSSLNITGPMPFENNTAMENGGAITVQDSTIFTEEGPMLTGNVALAGAGGGVHCVSAVAAITGCNFTANEAIWGGGLALFSSGTPWDEGSPHSGPANTTACIFEENKAVDGGAMYSTLGYDMIWGAWFENNLAEGSGGAYFHIGVLVSLLGATFVGNRAGDAGLAVQSVGVVESIGATTFHSNTYFCAPGQFGDEYEYEVKGTCRFQLVCSNCASSCEDIQEGVTMLNDTHVPTCETAMRGVDVSQDGDGGVTLAALNLDQGFYRTSAESRDILECHHPQACSGGVDPSQYCEEGYQGAYCAVCEEGYASGYQYSCSSCAGENKRSAIGASAAFFIAALVVIAFVIAELVRVVDENSDTESKLGSCRARMAKVIPFTSIKIVVVAWQIVTQFSAVVNVVYPDVYERFLSVIDAVNLNVGILLSRSCLVDINFYGRLLFATVGPLVVLGVLLATYNASRFRNRHSRIGLQAAKSKHLSIALFIMFIVYSPVSFAIFQTFVCEKLDDDVEYLRADYSLTCSTGIHAGMMAYAGLMILVYPVGIPAIYAWWLFSNRNDLAKVGAPGASTRDTSKLDHLQPMRDLWAPYKPHRYYYEVVECGRRIALTGLAVFLMPGSAAQSAIEVLLSALFMTISDVLSPFVDPFDAWLYRTGSWIIFLSMFLALLLKVDASDEDSQSQESFAKVLIAAHVGMILVVLGQAVLSVKRSLVAVRDIPVASQSSHSQTFLRDCEAKEGAELASIPPLRGEDGETSSRAAMSASEHCFSRD